MKTKSSLTVLFTLGCCMALAEVAAMVKFLISIHGFSFTIVIWSLILIASVYVRFVIGQSNLLFQKKWNKKVWLFEIFRVPVYVLYVICAYHASNGHQVCNDPWFVCSMMISQIVYLVAVSIMLEHLKVELEEES